MNEDGYTVVLPPKRRRSYRRVPIGNDTRAHHRVLMHPRLGVVSFAWSTYADAPGVMSQIAVRWTAPDQYTEVEIARTLTGDNRWMQLHSTEWMSPGCAREWWGWFVEKGFTVHSATLNGDPVDAESGS